MVGRRTISTRTAALGPWALIACTFGWTVLAGCKREDAKLREGAQAEEATLRGIALVLCPVDRAGLPDLNALSAEVANHIRQEDRDYARSKQSGDAGIKRPGSSAPSASANCEVQRVEVQPTTATVRLSRKVADGAATDYVIAFVKVANEWKADYHLQQKEAGRKQARQAAEDAGKLIENHEWQKARAKFLEAQKLDPSGEEDWKKVFSGIDDMAARTVGGRWLSSVEKDAMTDKENVFMSLPASNEIETRFGGKRATLVARCIKGEPDLVINIDAIVDGGIYGGAKAQYRFDAEPAQSTAMTTAEDHKGLFFREPRKWLRRVVEHTSAKLIVEIPLYARVPEAVTFDLTGADKAIPRVESACAK